MVNNMNWREVVIPFGKHKGLTIFQLYVNELDYLIWLSHQDLNNFPKIKKAVNEAMQHKNRVDPFSDY